MQQLPLDLQIRSTEQHGDFIISDCNSIAAQWIDRWPDWVGQFCALNIAGPEASGKSHLAAVWQAKSGAVLLGDLDDDLAGLGDALHFVIDLGRVSLGETGLFHLFNHTRDIGGSLLIISTQPVARMAWQLPDLASRMRAVNLAMIDGPDDRLLHALLHKNFVERQLYAPENVIQYLVARMERSFAAARDVVVRMDRLSLANRSQITLSLARSVMEPGQGDLWQEKLPQ
ncbi:MAG: HdaA/DnaA family protein [Candidatus Puniceispirillaceae bacterium]|jgi:chromosomal replication initiation ATPase DnaA